MKCVFLASCIVILASVSDQSEAEDVILMEGFDPMKVLGTWHVWKRNQMLMENTIKCISATVHHDENAGDIYKLIVNWMDEKDEKFEISFAVIDDRSHPARFLFKSDKHRVALSVLATDYSHWLVAYGLLGTKESYFIATKDRSISDEHKAQVEEVLKANKVAREFEVFSLEGC